MTGSLEIPDGVTSIESDVFSNCSGLNGNLKLPDSVRSIGSHAFYNCGGLLGDLEIPSGVRSIGEGAFGGCGKFTESLILPSGVSGIGEYTFYNCSGFTGSLALPSQVKSIGDFAFGGCSGLTGSLTIPSGVTRIGRNAFKGCGGFTEELTIPGNVTNIGEYAFMGCSGFTGSLEIPDAVTSIGEGAFQGCSGFTGSLEIQSGVTKMEKWTFGACSGLAGSLTIPSGVTSIDSWAFYSCKGLKSTYFKGNVPGIWGNDTFYNITATAYYPIENATWTQDVMKNYSGRLTWAAYDYNTGQEIPDLPESEEESGEELSTTVSSTEADPVLGRNVKNSPVIFNTSWTQKMQETAEAQDIESTEAFPLKAFQGNDSNEGSWRKAAFTDLVPGESYILLVVKDSKKPDLLASSNLLYIAQGNADENGSLTFTYVPRIDDAAEVQGDGMSNRNLADAEITVNNLSYTGNPQSPEVKVIYKGTVLEKDKDYILSGDAIVTEEGTYSITIIGKNDYAGSVTRSFKVTGGEEVRKGDINRDGQVNLLDLMECLNHVAKKTTAV